MLNIGAGEIGIILVAALLVLGPQRLPEFARMIGKFLREFRKQTDDVRYMVEREFYKMDEDVGNVLPPAPEPPKSLPRVVEAPPATRTEPAAFDSSFAATQAVAPLTKDELAEVKPTAVPTAISRERARELAAAEATAQEQAAKASGKVQS